uniref:Glutathione synthetase n=1 Tax=Globodera pallida TaxID=36090 RepID=A0A183C8Y0_GLOPA
MQGWRTHQEDAHNCIVDFADECSFFAVYDGHGGSEVSSYLKKNFPDFLKEHRMLEQQHNADALISTLQKLFVKFDDILRRDETVKIMTDLKAANSTTAEHCQNKECDREEKERTERENLLEEVHALSQESNLNIEHIIKQYAKCHNLMLERVTGAAADQPQNHSNSENELDSKRERKKRPIVFISPQLRKRSKIQSAAEDENVERQIGECTLSINENCKTIEQKGSENEGHKEHSSTKNRADGEAINNLNGSSAIDKCKEAQIEPSSGEQKKRDGLERQNSPNEENGHDTGGKKINADNAIKTPHSSALGDKADQNVGAGGEDDEEEDDPDYKEESGAVEEGEETTSSEEEEESSEEGEAEGAEDEDDGEEEELEMLFNSSEGNKAGFDSGSTACVALLFKGQFVVANIGDSRCVLCRAGKAVDLSADHKPEDLKEKERIEAAGLNLTRAFGDHFYKQTERLPLKDQMITALPDVTITERDGATDDFIIVACDGIWNSMTSQALDFEEYAVSQWHVCEMQLDAHGIPRPVEGVVHPMTQLLQFYANKGYRRVGKTTWFDPSNANYVVIPDDLCYLERMVKDVCAPSATTGGDGAKRGREQESAEKSTKRMRKHQNSAYSAENYAKDLVKDEDDLNMLVEAAVDLAHDVRLIKRLEDSDSRSRRNSDVASIIPFTLFPSPYPRHIFQQALDVQTGLQKLYFRVSCDYAFLAEQFDDVIKTNNLMRKMAEIMHEIQFEGQKQAYTLFLARSDYMVDLDKDGQEEYGLKQVEMNIGSVVGSTFGPRTAELHRQMLQKVGMDASNVPENRAYNTLAEGLYFAWQKFGDPDAVVVFAVLQGSVHRFDERAIEYELQRISGGKLNVVRMSSKEAYHKLRLDNDFKLRLSADGRVVAVVYSRSGPLPEWTDEEWQARRTIERSTAIKTSTMFSALSSSKKVQQVLAKPGMIERFLPDPEDKEIIVAIRKTFVGLWGLEKDDDETRNLVQHAINNPGFYVLKPQSEGGGHNYFDEELREKLQQFTHEERAAHTLMERIQPMIVKNYLVRPLEKPVLSDVVAELGVFGCLLGDKRDLSILHNKQHGYLVRTKPASSTESGITAGGVYDSLNLF